ncbi:MAG: hypothetical protein JWQ36_492, partial [Enterovirga sp.]|nr:hypothetical protein [Enterovirga sp.]
AIAAEERKGGSGASADAPPQMAREPARAGAR